MWCEIHYTIMLGLGGCMKKECLIARLRNPDVAQLYIIDFDQNLINNVRVLCTKYPDSLKFFIPEELFLNLRNGFEVSLIAEIYDRENKKSYSIDTKKVLYEQIRKFRNISCLDLSELEIRLATEWGELPSPKEAIIPLSKTVLAEAPKELRTASDCNIDTESEHYVSYINSDIRLLNTARRLPIVFCLDISPSMGWKRGENNSSIELLNVAVSSFIKELKQDTKARSAAEIAFVTFSTDIEMDTEFESINTLKTPVFSSVEHGGTQMANAVLRSIEKIEKRREQLENMEIGYYAPFMVLVTDGNPDKNDDSTKYAKAQNLVKRHCDSHIGASEIIVPFIIGVGDRIDEETLNDYSKGFTKGYFPIRGKAAKAQVQFNKVFQLIGNSTRKSIHLNGAASEIINTIQYDMNDLLADLAAE